MGKWQYSPTKYNKQYSTKTEDKRHMYNVYCVEMQVVFRKNPSSPKPCKNENTKPYAADLVLFHLFYSTPFNSMMKKYRRDKLKQNGINESKITCIHNAQYIMYNIQHIRNKRKLNSQKCTMYIYHSSIFVFSRAFTLLNNKSVRISKKSFSLIFVSFEFWFLMNAHWSRFMLNFKCPSSEFRIEKRVEWGKREKENPVEIWMKIACGILISFSLNWNWKWLWILDFGCRIFLHSLCAVYCT